MPKLSAEELRKLFNPIAIEQAFSRAKKKGSQLFRYEENPIEAMEKGFSTTTHKTSVEPKGLYFATNPADIPTLVEPGMFERKASALREFYGPRVKSGSYEAERGSEEGGVVRAIRSIDSKTLDYSDPGKWKGLLTKLAKGTEYEGPLKEYLSREGREALERTPEGLEGFDNLLTDYLKRKGTHVIIPDIVGAQPEVKQVVALVPKKTFRKYKGKINLLGLGGLATGGALLGSSDEAEAGGLKPSAEELARKGLGSKVLDFIKEKALPSIPVEKLGNPEMTPSNKEKVDVLRKLVGHQVGGKEVVAPPIVKYRKEASSIKSTLPQVEEGNVRLWRGNRAGEEGSNPSFTDDLPGIALPFRDAYGGKLSYVDVPASELSKHAAGAGATSAEFTLPKSFLSKVKTVPVVGGLALGGLAASQLGQPEEAEADELMPAFKPQRPEDIELMPSFQEGVRRGVGEDELMPSIGEIGEAPVEDRLGLPERPIVEGQATPTREEPGLYATTPEKMRSGAEKWEAIQRGEVLKDEGPGLLRSVSEMFLGKGLTQTITNPIDTAILASRGVTTDLEEAGKGISKTALMLGLTAVTAGAGPGGLLGLAGKEGVGGLLSPTFGKTLIGRIIEGTVASLPFGLASSIEGEKGEKGPKSLTEAVASPVTTAAEVGPLLLEMGANRLGTSLIGGPLDAIFDPVRKKIVEENEPSVVSESFKQSRESNPLKIAEEASWWAAFPVGFAVLGPLKKVVKPVFNKLIGPAMKGVYKATAWPLAPIKPYWDKVADLAWDNTSIPTIAGIGAVGAAGGALLLGEDDRLKGAAEGAGALLAVKGLKEGMRLPNPLSSKLREVVKDAKGNLTLKEKFKTFGETLQPAMERLREGQKNVAGTFRNARVQEANVRSTLSDFTDKTKDLLPSEIIELKRGFSGAKVKSPAVAAVQQEFEQRVSNLNLSSLYEREFRQSLATGIIEPLERSLEYTNKQGMPAKLPIGTLISTLKQFEKRGGLQSGKASRKEVQALLDEVIKHPTVNQSVKNAAVCLYDSVADTPGAVAKAAHHAMEVSLLDKLMKNPGVVSPILKEGYVESSYPGIKGMFVNKDVELELEGMRKISQMSLGWYQKFFLSPWKMSKTLLRPAAHARNLMSNVILNDWGGLPFWRADLYAKSLGELLSKNRSPELKRFLNTVGDTRFTSEEIFQPLKNARHGDHVWDMAYNVFDSVTSPARSLYAGEEQWFKYAKYLHNRELGMSTVEAATDAVKWTFNYAEITPAVARLRTAWWGAPFATWMTKAVPLTIETAAKHPVRFGKWIAMGYYFNKYALEQSGVSEEEWDGIKKTLPNRLQSTMMLHLPWRGPEGELKMLNLTWMIPGIGDMSELAQRAEESPGALATMMFQQPIANIAAAWKYNKQFSGAPIWHDWEGYPTKAAKMLNYTWRQLVPAITPGGGPNSIWQGGTDWDAAYAALTERPGAPSPEEALAAQFGFKTITVDPIAAYRKKMALDKIHRAEIMQDMRRQLRFATSAEEQDEIIRRHQEYLVPEEEEE